MVGLPYRPEHTHCDSNVLVLNRSFLPVHVITARRAFVLLYKRFAEAVSVSGDDDVELVDFDRWLDGAGFQSEDDDFVSTVTLRVRVPRIVRLTQYDRFPRRRVSFTRRNILARDDFTCQYCGLKPGVRLLTLDHVVPRALGGQHCWTNVVASCRRCNDRKGHRRLHETNMRLNRKPAMPKVNPVLCRRLRLPKYRSWRLFVKAPKQQAS